MAKLTSAKKYAMQIYDALCFYKKGQQQFSELVEFMDGDRDNDLLQSMKELDQKNFPDKYVSTGKEKCSCNGVDEGCHICGVMPAGAPSFKERKKKGKKE